ncbi:metal-dependent hydrolase [Marinimicrobium sp. ABcell2]|uniref:metal-dependent hydrolase n=1 Tax=Marinimicrobium sp. ABcell2 TaxID=3069751 RepID=UPI0027B4C234|nr:metal-dependent hydrolase [Marinimicrobium sp. ABcell2]MDQ2076567.1 metal-dependent hydrolase [Marinimicrobium sp. ABcell2]
MDIVTHGLMGALAAQAVSKPGQLRAVVGIGIVAGLLPDVDTLIRSAEDPLLVLSMHRHFTHSLVFAPLGALIAALLCWPLARNYLPFSRAYLAALAAYVSHLLLDFSTSYGIHLLWPFTSEPISANIIAVVDPVFTFLVLVTLILAFSLRRRQWAYIGLGLSCMYLAFGLIQHQRALNVAEQLAAERGQNPERIIIKPTMANLVLWRAMAVEGNTAYVDAVRVGFGARVYPGESTELLRPEDWQHLPEGSRVRRDLRRMYRYSDRLLAIHPEEPTMVGDARFSMLPTSAAPLWGITLDFDKPDGDIEWENRRTLTPEMRERFMAMVLGRDITL